MLLKYFYDHALAHASYMVGCQRSSEAIVVDPGRDIEQYLVAAENEAMRIVGAAETHIHADYVSGARELAALGAKLFVSDEGPADWKYLFASQYDAQLLKDGDEFQVGNVRLQTIHSPGHTPESISFVLTDLGGGANQPMGIFTGDFVFVGSVGRPDLLEEAAGIAGTAEPGARDLFRSIQRFKQLPDYLQIWPAHGAGSACGKGLGAIPSSTVGYEKLFNPAMQFEQEQEFVDYILTDQPPAPKYFAIMKRVNKQGPTIQHGTGIPPSLDIDQMKSTIDSSMVLDVSTFDQFAHAHVMGTINIPAQHLAGWAGWLVDYDQPLFLIASHGQMPEATRVLRKIGVENIAGFFDADQIATAGLKNQSYAIATPEELLVQIENESVQLIDVRSDAEWRAGHIPQAKHVFLGNLSDVAESLVGDKTMVVQCRTGGRSAIAASLMQAAGAEKVINMIGGIVAWQEAGLPMTESEPMATNA